MEVPIFFPTVVLPWTAVTQWLSTLEGFSNKIILVIQQERDQDKELDMRLEGVEEATAETVDVVRAYSWPDRHTARCILRVTLAALEDMEKTMVWILLIFGWSLKVETPLLTSYSWEFLT